MSQSSSNTALDQRYGRTNHRRWDLIAAFTGAGLLILIGVFFLASGGLNVTQSSVSGRDISHEIPDATTASLTFEVTAPAGLPVSCAVEAMSESFSPVAYKIVEIPPAEREVTSHTIQLTTVAEATAITVNDCWAVEEAD